MPDPLDATKRMGDIDRAKEDEVHNEIVRKALKRRRSRRYPSPRKVAADIGEAMLKEALVPAGPPEPAAPAAPATPPAPASPKPSWTDAFPASKGVDAETGGALDAAASGAINPDMLDDRQRGVIQGMHQGATDKVDPPNWFERMGRGAKNMWGKWGDLTNRMGGENYGPLMKYGLPAAGGGLLAYLLYRLFGGGGRDKYSYDKLAEFPEGFGKMLTDCQYGKEALPSMTSKSVPCQTDTNNGWSNRKVVRNKQANYDLIKEALHPAALGAMGGAGLGGLAGMGYGALMPGEDEEGEQRSRLQQALLKGLLGAGLGAGAGAGAGGVYGAMGGQEPELPPDAGMSDPGASGYFPGGPGPDGPAPEPNPRGTGFEEIAAGIPSEPDPWMTGGNPRGMEFEDTARNVPAM